MSRTAHTHQPHGAELPAGAVPPGERQGGLDVGPEHRGHGEADRDDEQPDRLGPLGQARGCARCVTLIQSSSRPTRPAPTMHAITSTPGAGEHEAAAEVGSRGSRSPPRRRSPRRPSVGVPALTVWPSGTSSWMGCPTPRAISQSISSLVPTIDDSPARPGGEEERYHPRPILAGLGARRAPPPGRRRAACAPPRSARPRGPCRRSARRHQGQHRRWRGRWRSPGRARRCTHGCCAACRTGWRR